MTLRHCIFLFLTVLLSACSQQLLGSLDEDAANKVISALRIEGVAAEKSVVGDGQWRVTVAQDEFAQAVQILDRRNLPPRPFEGLGRTFRKESLVSTPTEERARLIYAMSQELERSLREMDGVVVARVHPVIPPHDPLNPKRVSSTASVLIKYRVGSDLVGRESMVRALVAGGIEGLAYDDVRVLMVPVEKTTTLPEPPGLSRAVPPIFWGILGILLGLLMLSYFVLYWRDGTIVKLDELRSRILQRVGRKDSKKPGQPEEKQ